MQYGVTATTSGKTDSHLDPEDMSGVQAVSKGLVMCDGYNGTIKRLQPNQDGVTQQGLLTQFSVAKFCSYSLQGIMNEWMIK